MTELQEKMLHLQTISTIMDNEPILTSIATEEAKISKNLDVKARVLFYQVMLGKMKCNLIKEILSDQKFYAPLNDVNYVNHDIDNSTLKQ